MIETDTNVLLDILAMAVQDRGNFGRGCSGMRHLVHWHRRRPLPALWSRRGLRSDLAIHLSLPRCCSSNCYGRHHNLDSFYWSCGWLLYYRHIWRLHPREPWDRLGNHLEKIPTRHDRPHCILLGILFAPSRECPYKGQTDSGTMSGQFGRRLYGGKPFFLIWNLFDV